MDQWSVYSERELDNLQDINTDINMSGRDVGSFDNHGYQDESKERSGRERPLRPGTGIPPHHPQKLKKKAASKDSVFAIDVSDKRSTDQYTDNCIAPLPEPQTDVPVFSVTTQDSPPWRNKPTRYDSMESEQDSVSFAPAKSSFKRKGSSRERKKSKKGSRSATRENIQLPSASWSQTETETSPSKSVSYNNTTLNKGTLQAGAVIYRAEDSEVEATFFDKRKNSNASGILSGEDHTDLDGSDFLRYKPKVPLRHLTNKLDWHIFRKSESSAHVQIDDKKLNQKKVVSYVTNHILQRECSYYVWDKKPESTRCVCGRNAQWHVNNGKVNEKAKGISTWHQKTHTVTMRCDSYGEIKFRGFGCSTENSPVI